MILDKKILLFICYIFLGFFAFFLNYWTGSRGVFPIDTFVHFDSSLRILKQELPIRDFWINSGLFIDFIQAIFFKIFGINWKAYILHSSFFNLLITTFSFKIFTELEIKILPAFILALCVSVLSYPVSGTPFLDLHSAFFSLFALYFLLLFIKKGDYFYIFFSVVILGFAFLSKQVPASYFILFVTFFIFLNSYQNQNLKLLIVSFCSLIFFLATLYIYLKITNTGVQDFIFQFFIFPSEIGRNRHANYELNIKNIFLDFKFIYLFIIPIMLIILKKMMIKNFIKSKEFNYFLLIFFYTSALIYHQIYTKNQIFIFFLIPILCAFFLKLISNINIGINYKKHLTYFAIVICIFITLKYHLRFNEQRKFHELSNVKINNAVEVNFKKDFFRGLNWITPNFSNPKDELKIIEEFYLLIKNDKSRKIVITDYSFFSGLLNEKLHSPSRTFDSISYPKLGSKLYLKYKDFFRNNITKNKIESIYIFYSALEIKDEFLEHLVFNYLPEKCYKLQNINKIIKKIELKKCEYLAN